MSICKRLPFLLILFSLFSFSYFVTSASADHTPHKHKPRKAGLPGYNASCDNASGSGSFQGATPLVGQLDPNVDERGRPTANCINFTRYGYPIEVGEPGYIDINVPPSDFGRTPRDGSGGYSIACDSRQDTSPYGNNTWESGSCISDTGKSCCQNQTLEGYAMKIGDPGYAPFPGQEEACANYPTPPENLPPFMKDQWPSQNKELCEWIQAGKPIDGQSLVDAATKKKEAAEQGLQNAKDAKAAAELEVANAQTALDQAIEALKEAKLKADQLVADADAAAKAAEEERLAAIAEALRLKKIEDARLAAEEADRIAEEQRLAALEEARLKAEQEAAELLAAEVAAQQLALASAQNAATDAKTAQLAAIAAAEGNETAQAAAKQAYADAARAAQQASLDAALKAVKDAADQAAAAALAQVKAAAAIKVQAAAQAHADAIKAAWSLTPATQTSEPAAEAQPTAAE